MAVNRILFVMLHPGFLRYFEDALGALVHAGHDVTVAFESGRAKPGDEAAARRLAAQYPGLTWDIAPARPEGVRAFLSRADRTATRSGPHPRSLFTPAGRVEAWEGLATAVRLSLDYLRYFTPPFAHAHALRGRAEKRLPRAYRGLVRGLARTAPTRWTLTQLLTALERIVPGNPSVEAFVRRHAPDLLLVTPLVELGSQQVDYVKVARRLGIRSALCVASWDNLTSKGLVRVAPDHVLVWNEALGREAVELHGVPSDRVIITGAQPFDRWFTTQSSRTRDDFCREVGLDPSRPLILYVGSSVFIAPDEVPFVERWLAALRRSADPAVASAGVLIRPHPANADQWRAFDTSVWSNVAVWPAPGTDTARPDAARDYFDSLFHSDAVVGINTSAQIEAAIVGRPVLTVRAPEFAHAQDGTLHFRYLVEGCARSADSLDAHTAQLAEVLRDPAAAREPLSRFVHRFLRPYGLEQPAVPVFVGEVTALARRARPAPRPPSEIERMARAPGLVLAWLAQMLNEDRPWWVYAVRPITTAAVWLVAGGYLVRDACREHGYRLWKRLRRAGHRALHDGRKRAAHHLRRWRKRTGPLLRGAARRLIELINGRQDPAPAPRTPSRERKARLKVLFAARHPTYFRNFDSVIADLSARGHSVLLAAERDDAIGGTKLMDQLTARPGVSGSHLPRADADHRGQVAARVRLSLDYLRYLDPMYDGAPMLRARAAERAPYLAERFGASWLARIGAVRHVARAVLASAERALPPSPRLETYLRDVNPDLLLLTPLIGVVGSMQPDLLRTAKRLGIPTALCVWSWDHLSSKALIRDMPDRVFVWNDIQRYEAIRLHRVPSDRVVVTGAQCFDRWFDRAPTRTRESFCQRAGLPGDRPLVLYVGSALFGGSPSEAAFIRRWIAALRERGEERLRTAAILVRPHPQRMQEWSGVDLRGLDPVVVWGGNPVTEEARADYFDALAHADAVVGLNTSAFIEAAIARPTRPILAILPDEFRDNQEGTLHFRYLMTAGGGVLITSRTLDEHAAQLSAALQTADGVDHRPFLHAFVRPRGVESAATPAFVEAVERLVEADPAPVRAATVTGRFWLNVWQRLDASPRLRHWTMDDEGRRGVAWREAKAHARAAQRRAGLDADARADAERDMRTGRAGS